MDAVRPNLHVAQVGQPRTVRRPHQVMHAQTPVGEPAQLARRQVQQPYVVGHVGVAVLVAVADKGEHAAVGGARRVAVVVVAVRELLDGATVQRDTKQVRAPFEVTLAIPTILQPGDDARPFGFVFLAPGALRLLVAERL